MKKMIVSIIKLAREISVHFLADLGVFKLVENKFKGIQEPQEKPSGKSFGQSLTDKAQQKIINPCAKALKEVDSSLKKSALKLNLWSGKDGKSSSRFARIAKKIFR